MNITAKTIPMKRLGLSRRKPIATELTPRTSLINPTISNSIDFSTKPKDDVVADPTSETPNSGNNENLSLTSNQPNLNETPVSSKPKKGAYLLSLCKSTTQGMTRKRMLHQQSKSLIQPKRLKLDLKCDELKAVESNLVENTESCDTKSVDGCDEESGENVEMNSCEESGKNVEKVQMKSCEESGEHLENVKLKCDKESVENPVVKSSLQIEIDELKQKIATNEKHEKYSAELQGLITKWQEAGQEVIDELKEKITPAQDVKDILSHFKIDPGLFNLDSESE